MKTAQEYRDMAADSARKRQESFDRCDTDGFVSQYCDGLNRNLYLRMAEIAENGGKAEFRGLFLRETGERVKAVLREGQWGYYWMLLDANGKPTGTFVPDSKGTKRSKMYKLGFEVRMEMVPADARFGGSGKGFSGLSTVYIETYRTDGGCPKDAVVVNV
tara:strand:+ start:28556 stop:29035 length:480 start_codon:yes stop_codon:yes gene_type:complete